MASKIISPYYSMKVWVMKVNYENIQTKNICFDVLGRTFIAYLQEIQGNLFKTCILTCDVSNSTHLEMSMTKNICLHPKYLYPPTYFKLYLRLHSFLRKQFVILLKDKFFFRRKYLIAGIRLHTSLLTYLMIQLIHFCEKVTLEIIFQNKFSKINIKKFKKYTPQDTMVPQSSSMYVVVQKNYYTKYIKSQTW